VFETGVVRAECVLISSNTRYDTAEKDFLHYRSEQYRNLYVRYVRSTLFDFRLSSSIVSLFSQVNVEVVMTKETLASFHVFISSNIHIFDNHLVTYRVSTCLTICHTSKVVPQRRYNKDYFNYTLKYASLSTFSTINSGE